MLIVTLVDDPNTTTEKNREAEIEILPKGYKAHFKTPKERNREPRRDASPNKYRNGR